MFEKTLLDLVKGIRSHKGNEAQFISDCIREIKSELSSSDLDLKAEALNKLIYLHMLGYDMSWAAFWMIEVMAQPWFGHKRVAFLAASQSFTPETEVTLLSVHLFKKAFTQGPSMSMASGASTDGVQYEIGAALNCLANICNSELAQELLSDLYAMMNSTRPYIRKKAVLVLFKIFQHWPKALRLSFPRLKEKLEDEDQGVVSSSVNVICELARKNPKNYLSLAPTLFKLMSTSSNNWMLIKIVKLLGSLVPEEPRLAKKLAEPLAHLISTTPAKSLLYECINTVMAAETIPKSLLQLCLEKLRLFIEDSDQNLKYLGLLGLHRLMQKQPRVVSEYKDVVLQCLKDEDVSIRMRALDLLDGMVTVRNLQDIIHRLMEHVELSEGQAEYVYRETVFGRIIKMCSQDNYAFAQDLHWYISILVDLSFVSRISRENAKLLADQFLDVTIRVPAVRPFAVKAMTKILLENRLLSENLAATDYHMTEVLFASTYIVGEYSRYCTSHLDLIRALLQPCVASLPAHVQACCMQAVLKLYASAWRRILPWEQRKQSTYNMSENNLVRLAKPVLRGSRVFEDCRVFQFGAVATTANSDAHDEDPEEEDEEFKPTPDMSLQDWLVDMTEISTVLLQSISLFCSSSLLEVQERAVSLEFVGRWLADQISTDSIDSLDSNSTDQQLDRVQRLAAELSSFFADSLNPVHPKAQSKVPVPKGLDLESWINEPPKEEPESEPEESDDFGFLSESKKNSEKAAAAREKSAALARARRSEDPFYIHDRTSGSQSTDANQMNEESSLATVKPDELKDQTKSRFQYASSSKAVSKGESKKKKVFVVQSIVDAPQDFKLSDDEKGDKKSVKRSTHEREESGTLSDVDIDTPLRPDEVIPKSKVYNSSQRSAESSNPLSSSRDKSGSRKSSSSSKDKDRSQSRPSKSDDRKSENKSDSKRRDESHKSKSSKSSPNDVFAGKGVVSSGDGIRLTYEARPSAGRPNSLTVNLVLESSSKAAKLKNVDIHFSTSTLPHVSIVDASQPASDSKSPASEASKSPTFFLTRSLSPGDKVKHKIYVSTSSFDTVLSLPCKLYATSESSSKFKLPGALVLPISTLIVGEKISTDRFRDILSDVLQPCSFLKSASIKLGAMSVKEALSSICTFAGVSLVEAVNFTATYFGRTLTNQPVCLLVQASRDSTDISIDVKSTQQAISDSVLGSLIANLK